MIFYYPKDHHALDNLKALSSKICKSIVVAPSILKFDCWSFLTIERS